MMKIKIETDEGVQFMALDNVDQVLRMSKADAQSVVTNAVLEGVQAILIEQRGNAQCQLHNAA